MAAGKRWTRALTAALLIAALSGCGAPEAETPPETPGTEEEFTVDSLSTGKSDRALLRADGTVILSDTADADDFAAIAELLDSCGIGRIDYMILSHYDKDHIGSAAALVRAYEVGEILAPDYGEQSEEYAALLAACADTGTPWRRLTEDYRAELPNGTLLVDPPDRDYGDDNNNSLITTVTWKGERLLFLGDAKKKRMEEFLDAAEESYTLIKLPHHGDSCKPLLRLVEDTEPRWAVEMISVFEIVDQELLRTLEKTGTELFLTRDGPIRLAWDGTALTAVQDREAAA